MGGLIAGGGGRGDGSKGGFGAGSVSEPAILALLEYAPYFST